MRVERIGGGFNLGDSTRIHNNIEWQTFPFSRGFDNRIGIWLLFGIWCLASERCLPLGSGVLGQAREPEPGPEMVNGRVLAAVLLQFVAPTDREVGTPLPVLRGIPRTCLHAHITTTSTANKVHGSGTPTFRCYSLDGGIGQPMACPLQVLPVRQWRGNCIPL